MNSFDFLNPPNLFIEIGPVSWKVLNGDDFLEIPLERREDGSLTANWRESLVGRVRSFVNKKQWRPNRGAFVAVGARGVSLRRLSLPAAAKDEFERLLRLQIEAEFPLPPDELAWGWQLLGQNAGRQDLLVAAVKKELVESLAEILETCGIAPEFAVAALCRAAVCPPPVPHCAVLHLGAAESELVVFREGVPGSIRLLSWGVESSAPPPAAGLSVKSIGQLYLTGRGSRQNAVATRLAECAGAATPCPALETSGSDERSTAIAGLTKSAEAGSSSPPLILQLPESRRGAPGIASWKWAAAAAALLLVCLFFPYLEAVVLKPHLAKKLANIQANRSRLPAIDRELDFLQYMKRNQPPYLDTIYLVSKAAPQGTSFDSMSLSRRGELSMQGKMANAHQVTEFRSNLVQSAWFSSVVVEEQTPTPDQRVTVRLTAQVKPVDSRKPLVVDVAPAKTEPSTNAAAAKKPAKT